MLGHLLRAGLAGRLRQANVRTLLVRCRPHQVQLPPEDLPLIEPAASNQARALRILSGDEIARDPTPTLSDP